MAVPPTNDGRGPAVAQRHGLQPNAADRNTIPIPLATILGRFWPLSATATASKCHRLSREDGSINAKY